MQIRVILLLGCLTLVAASSAAIAATAPSCGNGIVEPGEQCDPQDPNGPTEGSDRFPLCNCDCTRRTRSMPLTLKMGLFYTVAAGLIFALRGSPVRVRGAMLRLVAAG